MNHLVNRLTPIVTPSRLRLLVANLTIVLVVVWLFIVCANLANYPRVHGDEPWIMSVSYKLVQEGRFGSDLFRGFFQADQHYFINLPVQQWLIAGSFWLFDPGIVQARLVSLLAGVVLIGVVAWLTKRWYGTLPACLAVVLLILWRAQLTERELPLPGAALTARYDLLAVTLSWVAIAGFDHWRQKPRGWWGFLMGGLAGLATLTQFFGAFVVPILFLFWYWDYRAQRLTLADLGWMVAGFCMSVIPYGVYILYHWSDFVGQSLLKGTRIDLFSLRFYGDNLWHEYRRYSRLVWPKPWPGSLVCAALLLYGCWQGLRWSTLTHPAERWLVSSLGVNLLGLALIDSTKSPLYALVLWPGLCIYAAATVQRILHWRRAVRLPLRILSLRTGGVQLLLIGLVALLLLEGAYVWRRQWQESKSVTAYSMVAEQLRTAIPADAVVLGPTRWWWALHHQPYYALSNLWAQWLVMHQSTGADSHLATLINTMQIDQLVIVPAEMGELKLYPTMLQSEFDHFLATCTNPVTVIHTPTYEPIAVLKITPCRK